MTVNARGSLPAAVVHAFTAATDTAPALVTTAADEAPPARPVDLADMLRRYLAEVDAEVLAVTHLSERIDGLVGELNAAREEQSVRLTVLDELQAAVDDPALAAFLTQAIKPRKPRLAEVIPERLAR